jgi:hypothetical protein
MLRGLFEEVVPEEAFGCAGFMVQVQELIKVRQRDGIARGILDSEEHSLNIGPLQEGGIVTEGTWEEPFENLQKTRVPFHLRRSACMLQAAPALDGKMSYRVRQQLNQMVNRRRLSRGAV